MREKKELGGLDNKDIIQPGDPQELNANNLINTVQSNRPFKGGFDGGSDILSGLQYKNAPRLSPSYGSIDKREYDEYERLIDGPFSLTDTSVDDKRAAGQGLGEKIWHSYGVKLAPKIGSHVLGSTVGLIDGFGEVAQDAYKNGISSSNWNKFFNNDFQRSLDNFNKNLDSKFPAYYTSQERDLGFWQSTFGQGAANFWTDSASQGLSFVAGAVISEYLTAGLGSAMIGTKAANNLKRISALRNTAYAQKSTAAINQLNKISRADRIYDGLVTGRRLLTGAFYEAGVEARHNYDSVVKNLSEVHLEKTGDIPTPEDMAKIKHTAVQISNGVFAGNAALVGYSNMLLFRRVFGSGMKANKNFANQIKETSKGVYKAKHKDWGRFRTWTHKNLYGSGAWGRYAAYEGVVEEGGQKSLDLAGQYAAEDMYLAGRTPGQMEAIGGLMENTFDGMAEAYGSTEGQKEIFLGAVLAAVGLPSFVQTNEKGETSFKVGYGKTGGIKDYLNQYAEGKQEVENLVEYMNENPDAVAAIKNNFDMLNGISTAEDKRDYALASENDFAYKNADHDAFFAYAFSRIKGGYYGDVLDSIEDMRDMNDDTFETMFGYEEQTQNMSQKQRKEFLASRKNEVIDTHIERAEKIKEVYDKLDNTRLNPEAKKIYAQALSTTADLDVREQQLITELEETGGVSLTAIVDKAQSDTDSSNSIFSKLKEFGMKTLGIKAKNVMENSETGQEVKREIGIKQFTAPGHPALVASRMMEKLSKLKSQQDIYENEDNVDGYIEVTEKIESLEDELGDLIKGINNGTAPNLSEEEAQILETLKKEDPAKYELEKEGMIKKFQDLRRIRAKRHQMLNLIQRMIDPAAANDVIQEFEEMAQDNLTEEERKNLPDEQQRLARKYKGKIVEFEHTDKNGVTTKHRVFVKDTTNKGLVRIPQEETYKLLQRKEEILKRAVKTEDDKAELELIEEELARSMHVTGLKHFNFSFLESAKNIKIMTEQELLLKQLETVTSVLHEGLAEKIIAATAEISVSKDKLITIASQLKDIKVAIQEAKRNKNGALYVNLNAIGRKGNFSLESAKAVMGEVKLEEIQYRKQLKSFNEDVAVLKENALRIQVIHTALSNPEIVEDFLNKGATKGDVNQFVNDLLGLTSLEDFHKKLGQSGFFDTNELTKIIGERNQDGGYDVDNQLLQDFLDLAGEENLSKEYLDLMNTDLKGFRDELDLLVQHRSDVQRMLNKMVNPATGEVAMFPPEGLTEEDLNYLQTELRLVDQDVKTIQGIIDMMEAEVEQGVADAANSDVIQDRLKALAIQEEIHNSLVEFQEWLNATQLDPADEAEVEEGETVTTLEDVNELLSYEQRYSPAFIDKGWTKTAGNHKVALMKLQMYQPMLERGDTLTNAEQMELQHVMSQLRFFRKSYDIANYSKSTGAKLQVVTRYNIRPEWENKIVFYDIAKAEKSGKFDDASNYKYASDLTENADRNEALENIKLLLVDSNNEPILVDGKLTYTDMNSSNEFSSAGILKGDPKRDLDENGNLLPDVVKAQASFINERNKIIAGSRGERFFYITGKSQGMPIAQGAVYGDVKSSVMGRLTINKGSRYYVVEDEKDLKDLKLEMALPAKGVKGADQKVMLFNDKFRVTSRFVYFGTPSKGYNGTSNLVPGLISLLSENQVNNIYNLSRYFAENQEATKGVSIEGKGFSSILKDQIMYGSRSKERSRKDLSIYMEKDAIYFGENGKNISLEELKDPSKYQDKHNEYKEFLSKLYFNVNSTLLGKDKQSRKDALDKKKATKTPGFIAPEYQGFNEIIVNDDLTTESIEWDNYTHYLVSGRNRSEEDIPVRVDMPMAFDESSSVEQATVPQFMNIYLEHSDMSYTKDELIKDTQDSNKKKTEPTPVSKDVVEVSPNEIGISVLNLDGTGKITLDLENLSEKDQEILKGKVIPKDSLEDSPFSQTSEDPDDIFFLETMETPSLGLDLNSELEWFNANMPKDKNGNPLVGIDLVKGLIDEKGLGKFTKDGNILLSDLMTTPGVLYHESWHAVTRRFISPEQRFALYDEVRALRGSTVTYKGKDKKMSELTDKEADEWLAEEFREYALAKGEYTVGARVKKSLIDRIFDKVFSLLDFFVNNKSKAQQLMSQLNTGYFTNPTTNVTVYTSKSEAYYEGTKLTATMKNNAMEGMTVLLFNRGLKSNEFNLDDFIGGNPITNAMYGSPGAKNTVYEDIEKYILKAIRKNPSQVDVLTDTMRAIKNNWGELKADHASYLERFNVTVQEESVEEVDKVREQFGKPQNEVDPSVYLPKAVRLLFATLPSSELSNPSDPNSPRVAKINQSGLPKLVDFGNILNFMYKEMANVDPLDFIQNLKLLSKNRIELKSVINRLGLESNDMQDKSIPQMNLIIQTMMQFDQSNNTFYTQLMTRDGGRMLINSNQNRIQDKIKFLWTNNFKDRIQNYKGLGEDVNGELMLNPNAKAKVGSKEKTFKQWSTSKKSAQDALVILDRLGITFTDPKIFAEMFNEEYTGISEAVNFILQEVSTAPVSDIFKGDIQKNLRTLINIEARSNLTSVDLQHRNSEGKTVHGVNLKTYADVLISKFNGTNRQAEIESLLKHDNLNNSYYLQRMLDAGDEMRLVVLEGVEKQFSTGRPLSKTSPVDIGVMYVNSVLNHGIVPLIRTADKKTEYGIKFGTDPQLKIGSQDMVARLQGYLADELKTASRFNTKTSSKLHRVDKLKKAGGNLRFFQGIVPSIKRSEYSKNLNDAQIQGIVNRETTKKELTEFLLKSVSETKQTMTDYNIATQGIDKNLLEKAISLAKETGSNPLNILAEQYTYEYMTGIVEQSKLLLGDFALYGQDLFKRASGISGTKTYPTSNLNILDWMNVNLQNSLSNKEHSPTLRVSNRAAVETEAPYLDQYIDTLSALGAPLELLDTVSNVYSNMEEFDGGGFITLDAYRSLMFRTGKWTYAQETFYQKVVEGETIAPEDMAIIPPIKPQLFGPQSIDNQRLMTFHKFALFPIIPGLLPGTAFDTINKDMIDNNIDYMIFESAVKVGGITDPNSKNQEFDEFYESTEGEFNQYKPMSLDQNGEVVGLQELSFSDLGIQLEVAPKTKKETSEGSQLRSLLPINIYEQGEVAEKYKDLESVIDNYHTINNALVERDFNSLIKTLKLAKNESGIYKLESNDLEEFKEALIKEFKKRDNPVHTIESIKNLLDSDTKFIEQLFEKNKIESLLYSLVNNNVVKRKMNGGQFVLQASTGFENNLKAIKQDDFDKAAKLGLDLNTTQLKPLKFYRKADPNNPNSKTLAMQVYIPSRFKDQFGKDVENIENVDPELLNLIGFRIPTEGPNSMDFIEIAGFLPKSFGDTVIVPSEIVGKAGSDYDIDKLNIYFPNQGKDSNSVQLNPDKSLKAQSKKALQNEMQRIIKTVLEHPASFDQLIAPVGAYNIKTLAKKVAMLRNPESFDIKGNKIKKPISSVFGLENTIRNSHRMFSGLGGIGIVATSSTQHAKGQRPGIDWNFGLHEDIKFNFEGQGFSLSRVQDVNNNHKISSIIGEYVTGYVDVTKEDFVFDINAGTAYAPLHMLLIRSGVPVDQVIYFMSQPIIDDYIELKDLFQPMYAPFPLKSEKDIIEELNKKYSSKTNNEAILFNSSLLESMVGKNAKDMNSLEKSLQIDVLNDFTRYKTLAEDLLLLKDATSVDTSNLNNSMAIRYAKQSINRLEQSGRFINLDELLYGNKEGSSTVAGFTKLLMETDGLFAEFKLGEYIADAKTFIDEKLFESTDKTLNMTKDNVIYKMKKFENFLATSVIQSTSFDYKKLSDRASSLFKGKDSLPRRINTLKSSEKFAGNLLIKELTPMLQVYSQNSKESTVDGLRLFNKKLQPFDVDLLSDAFMELKEIDPSLTEDLMIFSMLQSGYEFSPNSFFQVIPGTEALNFLSKYFKTNKNTDRTSSLITKGNMETLWNDFHKNYYADDKVVPNIFLKSINISKETGRPMLVRNRKDQYVSVTMPQGTSTIGGREVTEYSTQLFKANKVLDNGQTLYFADDTKGVKNNLVEATGTTASIVNKNTSYEGNIESEPQVVNTVLSLNKDTGAETAAIIKEKNCK